MHKLQGSIIFQLFSLVFVNGKFRDQAQKDPYAPITSPPSQSKQKMEFYIEASFYGEYKSCKEPNAIESFIANKLGNWKEFSNKENFPEIIHFLRENETLPFRTSNKLYSVNLTLNSAQITGVQLMPKCVTTILENGFIDAEFSSNVTLNGKYESNGSILNGKYPFNRNGNWNGSLNIECKLVGTLSFIEGDKLTLGNDSFVFCSLDNWNELRFQQLLENIELKSESSKGTSAVKELILTSIGRTIGLILGHIYVVNALKIELERPITKFVTDALNESLFEMAAFQQN